MRAGRCLLKGAVGVAGRAWAGRREGCSFAACIHCQVEWVSNDNQALSKHASERASEQACTSTLKIRLCTSTAVPRCSCRFDRNGDGVLDGTELPQFVKEVMPSVQPNELRYLQVMLDANGDGRISFEEFLQAARNSFVAARRTEVLQAISGPEAAAALQRMPSEDVRGAANVAATLSRISSALLASGTDGRRKFARWDLDGAGSLSPQQLAQFFGDLVQLSADDLRQAMSYMQPYDLNHDGRYSFVEVMVAMRGIPLVAPGGQRFATGFAMPQLPPATQPLPTAPAVPAAPAGYRAPAPAPAPVPGPAIHLEPRVFGTGRYLVDAKSNIIYSPAATPHDWPVPFGVLQPSGAVHWYVERIAGSSPQRANELLRALDDYLKTQKMRFQQLFETFDTDRNGLLDTDELNQLVQLLLPSTTMRQFKYLKVWKPFAPHLSPALG